MEKYNIVVINPSGPGRVLASHDTLAETHEWLEKTDAAHDHSLGVAIYDAKEDTYDCGNGEFSPIDECWEKS